MAGHYGGNFQSELNNFREEAAEEFGAARRKKWRERIDDELLADINREHLDNLAGEEDEEETGRGGITITILNGGKY
jgi:hypothetical protein